MPKTNYKPTKRRKIHQTRRKKYNLRRWIFLLILGISLIFTGFYLKNKIAFYYAMHFHKNTEQNLKNSKTEAERIEKIITEYNDKTFGFDISHYQKKPCRLKRTESTSKTSFEIYPNAFWCRPNAI